MVEKQDNLTNYDIYKTKGRHEHQQKLRTQLFNIENPKRTSTNIKEKWQDNIYTSMGQKRTSNNAKQATTRHQRDSHNNQNVNQ